MKLYRCLGIGVALLALTTGAAMAGVAGSAHDFSGSGWSHGEVCLPCHTPHHSNASVGFLWNHAIPNDADFTKHEGATLGNESLVCLGCHDGQTAIDSVGGQTGSTVITGDANIGRDLTDDHAVGVPYGSSSRRAPVGTIWGSHAGIETGPGRGLPLYGPDEQVECTTCHTPHDNTNNNFLRMSNVGSALCMTCHTAQ